MIEKEDFQNLKFFTTRSHYKCRISLSHLPIMDNQSLVSGFIIVGTKEVIVDVGCQESQFSK